MLSNKSRVIATLMTMSAADCALAQNIALEEVIVTAQRRSQSLQDVPLTVTALSSDTLTQNSVRSLADIGRITPGLSIANENSEPGKAIAIRGVATNTLGVGVEPSTAVFIDGVYQRDHVSVAMLVDVAQVEVLKGPQGTLFGRNAAAGAINVMTVAPEDEPSGKISASVGNESFWQTSAVLNLPLSDTVLTRTSALLRQRDGWQTDTDSPGADNLYEVDALAVRHRTTWLATNDLSIGLNLDYQEDDGTRGGLLIEDAGSALPGAGFGQTHELDDKKAGTSGYLLQDGEPVAWNADREIQSFGVSVAIDWALSDSVDLTSITSYRDSKNDLSDSSSGLFSINTEAFPYVPGYAGFEDYDFETINQELRISGATDALDWFVGFNYFYDESSQLSNFGLPAFAYVGVGTGMLGDVISDNMVDTESYAVFGDVIYAFSERSNLTFGLRYSYAEKEVSWDDVEQAAPDVFFAEIEDGIVALTGDKAQAKADWDNVSGRLVLDHSIWDDTMIYASVAQGYKSGGFNSQLSPGASPDEEFDQEESVNYELGWKAFLFDAAVTFNGALFFNDYSDFQFQVAAPGAIAAENIGADAEIYGADIDVTWSVTDALTLSASGSWLNAEFTEDVLVTGPAGTEVAVEDGQTMARAPDFSGLLGADYLYGLSGGASLRFNLNYFYSDDYRVENVVLENLQGNGLVFTEDDIRSDSYGLLNARISFITADEELEVALWASNLTDEDHKEGSKSSVANAVYNEVFSSVVSVSRNEPRMYGIEIEYRF